MTARIGACVLLVALGGLAACTAGGDGGDGGTASTPESSTTVPNLLPDDEPAATDGPRPGATDVVLTFAGWNGTTDALEAAGYVSPVVEAGGTCTLQVERDGQTAVVTAPAEPDATTTICGDLQVPRAELSPGEWTVVLSYVSPTSEGTSEPLTVEVPR